MSPACPVTEIPLAGVDLENPLIPSFAPTDPGLLMESLDAVGLLSPPWLRRRGGRWQVVAGARRVKAAARLGWERLPAQVLPARTPVSRCLLIHLHDNAFTRAFNPAEQAALTARLVKYWDHGAVVARFLPLLGLPPSPRVLLRLLALAGLETPFQVLAARGRLAITAGATLGEWDPGARAAVLPYFENLLLSQSQQEELLEGLELLGRREGVPVGEILSRLGLRRHLTDPALSLPERLAAVRQTLARRTNPRLSAAREDFAAALVSLGLKGHPRLSLAPPPAFEGPDFRLEIRFRDALELETLLKELESMVRREEFSRITRG